MLWKIKRKNIITYLIYNIFLLTLAYFLNRFFQVLIFVLFFNFIQNCFNYRFHAETIIQSPIKAVRYCKIITVIVEIIYMIFCKELNISVYSNLLIIFIVALLNALVQFSLENLAMLKQH